jgi:hypothetical protein
VDARDSQNRARTLSKPTWSAIESEFGVSPEVAGSLFISLKIYVRWEEKGNRQRKKLKWRRGNRKYVLRKQSAEVLVELECI